MILILQYQVRRLILCTGKIYYELLQAKLDKNIRVRIIGESLEKEIKV